MKKRFIVLIDSSTKEQDDAFLDYIKQSGQFGWWHWLNGSWLLTSTNLEITSQQICNKVMEIYPNIHNMVLEFKGFPEGSWHGFGPNGEEKNMFKWMRENW